MEHLSTPDPGWQGGTPTTHNRSKVGPPLQIGVHHLRAIVQCDLLLTLLHRIASTRLKVFHQSVRQAIPREQCVLAFAVGRHLFGGPEGQAPRTYTAYNPVMLVLDDGQRGDNGLELGLREFHHKRKNGHSSTQHRTHPHRTCHPCITLLPLPLVPVEWFGGVECAS